MSGSADKKLPPWRATPALTRAIIIVAVGLTLGLLTTRVEFAIFAVPFAVGTALLLREKPTTVPTTSLSIEENILDEEGTTNATIAISNDSRVSVSSLVVVHHGRWVELNDGDTRFTDQVKAGTVREIGGTVRALRWGPSYFGPLQIQHYACGGLLYTGVDTVAKHSLKIQPKVHWFHSRAPLTFAAGISGVHRTHRPGDGGDLAEIRPFRTGDKLRRIDWRTSMRQGELHVAATYSERDVEVALVIDMKQEVGYSGGIDGAASLCDRTVRAAASLGAHYLLQGDRVGGYAISTTLQQFPAGTGRKHLTVLRHWLGDLNVNPTYSPPPLHAIAAASRNRKRLWIFMTPLISNELLPLITQLAQSGQRVLCVDTLPTDILPAWRNKWTPLAWRLWQLERGNLIRHMSDRGVPVVPWDGAGSLDAALNAIAKG